MHSTIAFEALLTTTYRKINLLTKRNIHSEYFVYFLSKVTTGAGEASRITGKAAKANGITHLTLVVLKYLDEKKISTVSGKTKYSYMIHRSFSNKNIYIKDFKY